MPIAFGFWFDKWFIALPKSYHPPHTIVLVKKQNNTSIQIEVTYTSSNNLDYSPYSCICWDQARHLPYNCALIFKYYNSDTGEISSTCNCRCLSSLCCFTTTAYFSSAINHPSSPSLWWRCLWRLYSFYNGFQIPYFCFDRCSVLCLVYMQIYWATIFIWNPFDDIWNTSQFGFTSPTCSPLHGIFPVLLLSYYIILYIIYLSCTYLLSLFFYWRLGRVLY